MEQSVTEEEIEEILNYKLIKGRENTWIDGLGQSIIRCLQSSSYLGYNN